MRIDCHSDGAERGFLFGMSKFTCAICETEYDSHLELQTEHFQPRSLYPYFSSLPENFTFVCSLCNASIAKINAIALNHTNVKIDLLNIETLSRKQISDLVMNIYENSSHILDEVPSLRSLLRWVEFMSTNKNFDNELIRARADIKATRNEDEFIQNILVPIFEFLTFEGLTVLHHSGALEHGKDIVFYQRDLLGSFIFYSVVACNQRIHTNSSKTSDSGHYSKIIDQVSKCYYEPWREDNLKRDAYIDKVIVATPSTITNAAMTYFRRWEEKERRHLVFLDGESLAGFLIQLRLGKK